MQKRSFMRFMRGGEKKKSWRLSQLPGHYPIGDRPGKLNATFLTDFIDYAPESNLGGLPYEGRKRLQLLIDLLHRIISSIRPVRFTVAITECSQIEEIIKVNHMEMDRKLLIDFEEFAPPDCIYDFELN